MMETVSIGFEREDGDFEILSTLNNNGEHMSSSDFQEVTQSVILMLREKCQDDSMIALIRQDCPDIVEV